MYFSNTMHCICLIGYLRACKNTSRIRRRAVLEIITEIMRKSRQLVKQYLQKVWDLCIVRHASTEKTVEFRKMLTIIYNI